jgi:hypothetical protein
MKIELTIKASYMPSWGAYEGVRELIQNAKDAQVEFGAYLDVRYRRNKNAAGADDEVDTGHLVIENEGCTLPHEALLFGHTSKGDGRAELIGKFGEGLKLGVLALVRAGHSVKIRSGSEVWSPRIERSEKFQADVLVFHISEGRKPENRVQVEVGGITEAEWDKMSTCFLFLGDKRRKDTSVKTSGGSLLLTDEAKGRIYVKGIFVQTSGDMTYGYDLAEADVDRDRKMVQSFDLGWQVARIWREALHVRPDLVSTFMTLLETETDDVKGVSEYNADALPDAVKDAIAQKFTTRHGESALPVATLADSADVEHLGKHGIVCPKPLRLVLETKLGSVDANKKKLAKEAVKRFGWHELTSEEQANLTHALFLVSGVERLSLSDVDVIECRDAKILGLYTPEGRVQLTRKVLASPAATLETLVHETAHKAGGADGEHQHVANIERIWSGIVARLTSKETA